LSKGRPQTIIVATELFSDASFAQLPSKPSIETFAVIVTLLKSEVVITLIVDVFCPSIIVPAEIDQKYFSSEFSVLSSTLAEKVIVSPGSTTDWDGITFTVGQGMPLS